MLKTIPLIVTLAFLPSCIVPVAVPFPATKAAGGAAAPVTRLAATAPESLRFDGLLNGLRRENGRAPLVSNAGLDRVAASHAAAMRTGGYVAHRDRAGRKATGRVRAAGISTCPAGENLARGQGSVESVFRDWVASPGHRSNMLNPNYANYGLGRSGDYWVLVMLFPC